MNTDVRRIAGTKAELFYLPGHKNTFASRNSHIAKQIEAVCTAHDFALTHMAYYGWELSRHHDIPAEGQGYIRHWLSQALDLLDQTVAPQILVGYSMGGPIALQLARLRPMRIKAIIGLACGFGVGGQAQAKALYGNADFVGLDGKNPLCYNSKNNEMQYGRKLGLNMPLHLLHGMQDEWVAWQNTIHLSEAWDSVNVEVTLEKSAGHGLNECRTSEWLAHSIIKLIS